MLSVELPVSLKTSFSVSPFSRLTPLKEESCDVVLICARMLLYWLTRLARAACATGSWIGGCAVVKASTPVSVPPTAPPAAVEPSVEEAYSLTVVIVSTPLASIVAIRLLA